MKSNKVILIICSLAYCLTACGQTTNDRLSPGKEYAEYVLKETLADTTQHNNVVRSGTIIVQDSLTAIGIAEPILFGIYGKSNITSQRPYEIYHIDNYWVLSGTLPKGWKGGTFLIIIDDRNSRILKISHGK